MAYEKGKTVHFPLMSDADSDEWDDNISRISIRDWCLVEYQGNMYPAEVQKIVYGKYHVSVMVLAGNNWKWLVIPDEIFYTADKLAKRLNLPFIVNNCGHFGFLGSGNDLMWVQNLCA